MRRLGTLVGLAVNFIMALINLVRRLLHSLLQVLSPA